MGLAERQENDLHTPITHYEILTEKLKDARIDKLEEVIGEKINSVHECIDSLEKSNNKGFAFIGLTIAIVGLGTTLIQVFMR